MALSVVPSLRFACSSVSATDCRRNLLCQSTFHRAGRASFLTKAPSRWSQVRWDLTQDLPLGVQPILHCTALPVASLGVQFVRALRDSGVEIGGRRRVGCGSRKNQLLGLRLGRLELADLRGFLVRGPCRAAFRFARKIWAFHEWHLLVNKGDSDFRPFATIAEGKVACLHGTSHPLHEWLFGHVSLGSGNGYVNFTAADSQGTAGRGQELVRRGIREFASMEIVNDRRPRLAWSWFAVCAYFRLCIMSGEEGNGNFIPA